MWITRWLDRYGWAAPVALLLAWGASVPGAADSPLAPERELKTGEQVTHLAFTRDSKRLLTAADENTLRVFEVATGKEQRVIRGPGRWIYSAAVSPDGTHGLIGVGGIPGDIALVDLETGKTLRTCKGIQKNVRGLAFLPNGKRFLSVADERVVREWDVATGKVVRRLEGHAADGWRLAVHPKGRMAASGDTAGKVIVWDLRRGKPARTFPAHAGIVRCVVYSADGKTLATSGDDARVRIWSISGALRKTLKMPKPVKSTRVLVAGVALSPDGKQALTTEDNGRVQLWDARRGRPLALLRQGSSGSGSRRVAWSPDGARIAAADSGVVRIWTVPE